MFLIVTLLSFIPANFRLANEYVWKLQVPIE